MVNKENGKFLGLVSLDKHHDGESTEVSYQLMPIAWRKGYATEVVKEVIHYSFTKLNLPRLIAETQTANKSSCKLLERVGMTVKETVHRFGEEQKIYILNNTYSNSELTDVLITHHKFFFNSISS
jgi:ribosomal-protein-alanine N-acetyltransferase